MRRAVFLDRDGVINRAFVRDGVSYPPQTLDEVELLPGVQEALELFRQHDLLAIVVTNQPDVARGTQTRAAVETINRYLSDRLPLHAIFTCYHDNADACACRKPKPGLLLQAAQTYGIDLSSSFMIGDRWSDVVAGQTAGCVSFLIDVPYNGRERCAADYVVPDIIAAARQIFRLLPRTGEEDNDTND